MYESALEKVADEPVALLLLDDNATGSIDYFIILFETFSLTTLYKIGASTFCACAFCNEVPKDSAKASISSVKIP